MSYSVEITGMDQLVANLRKIDSDIRGTVALKAVNAGGIQIENKARMNAPVLTGALRNSVSTISKQIGNGAEAEIGFRGLAYARIQEYGGRAGRHHSVTITGKHYLERAISEASGNAFNAMADVIGSYLRS